MSNAQLNLTQLKKGERAFIKSYQDKYIGLKMMELGCFPGQEVTLEQIAPLGDPIAISFNGSLISLRRAEAETIHIIFAS
ncbi:MAG: ferrous iron transport protein A [Flavobacteriales bacterium]